MEPPINVPTSKPAPKKYRLYDGTLGSEYDALREVLRNQEAHLRQLEERIEITRIRMQTADGRPL